MDENLDALIERIKREGTEKAEKEAKEIGHKAREKAEKIIDDAKRLSDEILRKSEEDCKRRKQAMLDELELAARDIILSMEQKILKMFRNILEEKIGSSLSADQSTLINSILEKWQNSAQGWRIYLSESDLHHLTEDLLNSLRERIKGGLEVQPDSEIKAGFKIMAENESYYLDFTAGSTAELLMERLSPPLRAILRKPEGKEDSES